MVFGAASECLAMREPSRGAAWVPCHHMSRDSRQHCLRTRQRKISRSACCAVKASVKLKLDESSTPWERKKPQNTVTSRSFPSSQLAFTCRFVELFFVSCATQLTNIYVRKGFAGPDCHRSVCHLEHYPCGWVRNVWGRMRETSVTWHLITTISQPAAPNIRSHWQLRNT